MDILERIIASKREIVKIRKRGIPESTLEKSLFFNRKMPSFSEALSQTGPSIIGEFKRKSPSKGIINLTADVRRVAVGYHSAGVAAMSVLTDEEFFGGMNSDLEEVAALSKIPVLRKDFIIDIYQVTEAKAIGASAILLIASILSRKEIEILTRHAHDLGMDTLVEVHDQEDIDKLDDKTAIVGVNNRNLRNFEVSLERSAELLGKLPRHSIKVAESGFQTSGDVMELHNLGFDAFLIGANFMSTDDPGSAAAGFINKLKEMTS